MSSDKLLLLSAGAIVTIGAFVLLSKWDKKQAEKISHENVGLTLDRFH